jgi:hypothetical protein
MKSSCSSCSAAAGSAGNAGATAHPAQHARIGQQGQPGGGLHVAGTGFQHRQAATPVGQQIAGVFGQGADQQQRAVLFIQHIRQYRGIGIAGQLAGMRGQRGVMLAVQQLQGGSRGDFHSKTPIGADRSSR